MGTVYITKAKIDALIKYFSLGDNRNYKELIFNEILEGMLSKPELNNLLDYKKLLEGIDSIPLYKKKIFNNKNVNKRLVYIGGFPSYHENINCQRLSSDYENYEIPAVIPSNKLDEYREFFIDNKELYLSNIEVFFARVEIKFNVKVMNIKRFSEKNSGINVTENVRIMSLEQIRAKIESLLFEMKNFKTKDENHKKEIESLGFGSHRAKYTDESGNRKLCIEDASTIIYKWHNYKAQLKSLIKQYYISDLNPELNFNKDVLEQCGFQKCKQCS